MRPDHPFRQKGERHPAAKLTDSERLRIQDFRDRGYRAKQIAGTYNVHINTVYRLGRP